jgi:excisionase family DNA binding protein
MKLLTAEELSQVLNIAPMTVKKLAKTKQLPCIYKRRRLRFDFDKVLAYFKQLEGGMI